MSVAILAKDVLNRGGSGESPPTIKLVSQSKEHKWNGENKVNAHACARVVSRAAVFCCILEWC